MTSIYRQKFCFTISHKGNHTISSIHTGDSAAKIASTIPAPYVTGPCAGVRRAAGGIPLRGRISQLHGYLWKGRAGSLPNTVVPATPGTVALIHDCHGIPRRLFRCSSGADDGDTRLVSRAPAVDEGTSMTPWFVSQQRSREGDWSDGHELWWGIGIAMTTV